MPNAYYTCNLLPVELVVRAGYSPRWLGEHLQDPGAPARRDALSVHPMTCPYVTRLVAAADALLDGASEDHVLLVPGGCDAMRRLGDLLSATYPGRVFQLSLARSSEEEVVKALAADLERLEHWLERRAVGPWGPAPAAPPASIGPGALVAAPRAASGARAPQTAAPAATRAGGAETGPAEPARPLKQMPRVDYPSPPHPGGVFVVAGPLTDDSLLRLIEQLGVSVSGLESCTSPDRWKPLETAGTSPAETAGNAGSAAAGPRAAAGAGIGGSPPLRADDGYYLDLARELLAVGMCPRRSTAERRDYLVRRLETSRPSSVIYARQSFCDPGAYDAVVVAQLAQERGLPYLEIEVGFPFEASGPLRTRVEAFLEAQLLDDELLDDLLGKED